MRKLFNLSFAILFIATAIQAQNKAGITLNFPENKKYKLYLFVQGKGITIKQKGPFTIEKEFELNEPVLNSIVAMNGKASYFWVEEGETEVNVYPDGRKYQLEVKGSESQKIYEQLVERSSDFDAFYALFQQYADHTVALSLINSKYRFLDYSDEELLKLRELIDVPYEEKAADFIAYLNTIDEQKMTVGASMKHFVAKDLEGNRIDTKDFEGSYLLVDVASIGCGPCWKSYEGMKKQLASYPDLKTIVLSVDKGDDTNQYRERWNDMAKRFDVQLPWPVLYEIEDKEELLQFYYTEGTPTYLLVSPNGEVLERWFGANKMVFNSKLKKHLN